MFRIRMHRYFRRNENARTIEAYMRACSVGDWFVLYQMSKSCNSTFFMDFLVTLARYTNNFYLMLTVYKAKTMCRIGSNTFIS